ncbi:T9SS type A sorting domain-containing protein [Lewinella sp. LCG006]|uniref:T9SS type A sorting domain-containing protein n=1 Tax=Lewinella sp. LCG006 TaxID=3231911 RepID=UPI00345F30B6
MSNCAIRIVLLVCVFINGLLSQPNSFFVTYGGEELDLAFALSPTQDNNYVFVGGSSSFGEGYENTWLVKTDIEGTLLWQKAFGGDYTDTGYSVHETSDNGYLVAGVRGRFDPFGGNVADAYALKTNSDGDTLWTFLWEVGPDSRASFDAVTEVNDSTYILAGTTDAEINGGPPKSILVALNSDGDQLWEKMYEPYSYTYTMIPTREEGYCIGGFYGVLGGFVEPLLIVADIQGDMIWTKRGTELGIGLGTVTSVIQDENNNYLVLGNTQSSDPDVFVSKLDVNGNLLWSRRYGDSSIDQAFGIVCDEDGGYTFGGNTPFDLVTGDTTPLNVWLVHLDSEGEMVWEKTFGTEERDIGRDLQKSPDGGYVITGYTDLFYNAFLAKTDSLGNIDVFTSVFAPDLSALSLEAFPNPASDELTVVLPENLTLSVGNFIYTITDLSGKTIRRAAITRNPTDKHTSLSVSITDLPSGFYVISLNDGERTYAAKFVKQ